MQLWNENQAGDYLGKKPTTMQQWRWTGYGPPYLKIGRNVRYEPEDVKAWARAQQRTSTSDKGGNTEQTDKSSRLNAGAKAATDAPA